jgi:hypothetical protein
MWVKVGVYQTQFLVLFYLFCRVLGLLHPLNMIVVQGICSISAVNMIAV